MSLVAEGVGLSVLKRSLLKEVSLRVEPGQIHALLGPNGAGKTSLLRLLCGDRIADAGSVKLDNRPLQNWPADALARRRAVQSQDDSLRFPLRADEVVALGRLPHAPESEASETRIVQAALALCDAGSLAKRRYLTLSGGERSRVRMARAFAQEWEQFESSNADPACYLLLDEPAAHLDIGHQHFAMQLLRRFAQAGGGVLVILHDPNLALAYADTVSLLSAGRLVRSGPADEVLIPEILMPVYGVAAQRLTLPDGRPFLAWPAADYSRQRC